MLVVTALYDVLAFLAATCRLSTMNSQEQPISLRRMVVQYLLCFRGGDGISKVVDILLRGDLIYFL